MYNGLSQTGIKPEVSKETDPGSFVILSVTNQQFLGKILEITAPNYNSNKILDSGLVTLAPLDIKLY